MVQKKLGNTSHRERAVFVGYCAGDIEEACERMMEQAERK